MSEAKQFDISKKAVIAAFQAVKENAGSYGADEQTIKEFEEHLNNNLYKLWNRMHQEVISRTCKGSSNTQEKWWNQNFGNSNSRRQNRTNGCEDVL